MSCDWYFKCDNQICNFRTVGVLIKNGKILVQREKNGNEYALPGGHVKIGENSEQALIREYKEETGADIICKRLIWTEECFWKQSENSYNTIAFYYLIELADGFCIPDNGEFVSQKDNCSVVLGWLPIENLNEIIVYPSFIKKEIFNITDVCRHFITTEE